MRRAMAWTMALLFACDGGDGGDVDPGDDCPTRRPEPPAAGPLRAGTARIAVPAPVGIGTAGASPIGGPSNPTPFANVFPGTDKVYGPPELRALALTRGEGHEVVFLRMDAIGVFAQLRNAVVDEASARIGRDLDDVVVFGATHTHSGPGRILNTGSAETSFYDLIVGGFFPEFYERFVDAAATVIVASLETAEPARVGVAVGDCPDGHADRRCEDGETYQNGTLPLLVVEREGQIDGLLVNYAVHGTAFGVDDLVLSRDVSGAIESAVAQRFDHPVEVAFFNGWAADMSLGPAEDAPRQDHFARTGTHERVQRVGWTVAEAVDEALGDIRWLDDPAIEVEAHRIPIDRERIGYEPDVFEDFLWGGVYCGTGAGTCDPPTVYEDIDDQCIPFSEAFPAPLQVIVSVGRIGDVPVLTWPGEPGTRLAEELIGRLEASDGIGTPFFLGYTQDYLGYSILEEDWWFAGYEASGALWGPRQGEYLVDQVERVFGAFWRDDCPDEEPARLVPFPYSVDERYVAAARADTPDVATDVAPTHGATDAIVFAVDGHDPWFGTPRAWLEDDAGEPFLAANGELVSTDGYAWDTSLVVEPAWTEEASSRTFRWTVRLPVRQPVPGAFDVPDGTWQVVVEVPQPDGGVRAVRSALFEVATE